LYEFKYESVELGCDRGSSVIVGLKMGCDESLNAVDGV
jgi:hypothetical protein